MTDARAPGTPPDSAAWRRRWMAFLVVCLVSFTGGALLGGRDGRLSGAALRSESRAEAVSNGSPDPLPGALRIPGPVPARASGKFTYAIGTGRLLGRTGPVRRFHVAVERGSGEDLAAFTAAVEATLGDSRSWVGDGRFRLQRVSPAVPADFTVFLATRYAAEQMCARGGTDITVGGVPFTSCRTAGRAIINLDRWRLSAPPYVAANVPLTAYRQYVVNHEVGHEFGQRHQGCPKRGGPAPVMVQQTLTLRGCVANPWPRVRNRQVTGPLV